jgi:hypothetical protein
MTGEIRGIRVERQYCLDSAWRKGAFSEQRIQHLAPMLRQEFEFTRSYSHAYCYTREARRQRFPKIKELKIKHDSLLAISIQALLQCITRK